MAVLIIVPYSARPEGVDFYSFGLASPLLDYVAFLRYQTGHA